MQSPRRNISPERKALYYAGMVLTGLGAALFFSVFITGALHFGDFTNFEAQMRSSALRGVGGMGLMIVGAVLMSVGALGAAGSGVVLDPEKAREDVEPWARMGGGVLNDALSEVDVLNKLGDDTASEPKVMVRCRECQALNEEDANFCNHCGARL